MANKDYFTDEEVAAAKPTFGLMQTGNFELQGVEGGDYVSAAASGFTQLGEAVGGVAEYAGIPGGAEFAEASRKGGEYWREDMTPAGKLAMNREWADTTEDAAWKDIDTWLLNLTQAAPMTAAAMTPVGVAARAGAGATKLAAIGAGAETFLGAGITQSTISGEIDKMKPDELKSLAESQGLDIGNMKAPEFKQMVKDRASRLMVPGVGLASGALGAISGPIQGKLFVPKNIQLYRKFAAKEGKEKAAKYILKKIAKGDGTVKEWVKRVGQGTAVEAIQEGMQEGVEHAGSQVALNRDPTEGLAESMVAGAALGAGMGGPATAASRASLPKDIQAALDYESKKGPSTEPGAPPTQGIPTETTSFPPITGGAPPAPAPFVGPANENFPPINKVPNIDEVVAPQEEEGFPEVVDIPIDPKAHKGFPSIIDNAIGKVEPPKKTKQKKVTAKTAKAIAKSKGGVPKKSEKGPKVETKDMSAGPEKMESLAEDLEKINEGMKVTAEKQRIKKEKTAKAIAKEMETKPKPSTKKTGLVKDIIKDDRMSFNRMKVVGNSIKQKGKDGKWKNVSKDKSGDARQEYMTDVNVAVQAAVAEMNNLRKSGATEAQVKKVEALISSVASYERLDSKTGGPTREWSVRGEMKSYSKGTSFSAPAINKFLKNIETEIGRVERNVNLKTDKVGGETTRTARVKATKKVKAEQRQARKDTTAKAEAAIVAKKASNKRASDKKASEQAVKDKRDDESVTHGTKHRGKVAPTVDAKTGIDKRARDVLSIVMGTENYTDSELAKKLGVELEQISRQSRAFLKKMINHQPLNKLTPEQIDLKNKLFDEFMGAMGSDQSITKQLAKVTTADRTITKKLKKDAGIAQSGTTAEEFTDFELFGKQMKQFMNTLQAKYKEDFGDYIREGVEGKHTGQQMHIALVRQGPLSEADFVKVMDFVDTIQERKGAAVPDSQSEQVAAIKESDAEAARAWLKESGMSEEEIVEMTADLEGGLEGVGGFEIEGDQDIYGVDYRASGYDEINIDVNDLENQQGMYSQIVGERGTTKLPSKVRKGRRRAFKLLTKAIGYQAGDGVTTSSLAREISLVLDTKDPLKTIFLGIGSLNIADAVLLKTIEGNAGGVWQPQKEVLIDGELSELTAEIKLDDAGFYEAVLKNQADGTMDNGYDLIQLLAHEMIHAATGLTIESGNKASQELEALRVETINTLKEELGMTQQDIEDTYGFKNAAEFIAEALTNPEFQGLLNEVMVQNRTTKKHQSLWSLLVDTIGNMLGIPVNQNSVLNSVLLVAPELTKTRQGQIAAVNNAKLAGQKPMMYESLYGASAVIDNSTIDLSEKITGAVKDGINAPGIKTSMKEFGLRWLTLDGIVDVYADKFKGLPETFYRNTKKFADNPVNALNELLRLKQHEASKNTAEARDRNTTHRKLEMGKNGSKQMAELGDIMNLATINKMHVDLPFNDPMNAHLTVKDDLVATAKNQETYDVLAGRFNSLKAPYKAEYGNMREFYKEQFNKLRNASILNLAQVYGYTGDEKQVEKLIADLNNAHDAEGINKAYDDAKEAFAKTPASGTHATEVREKMLSAEDDFKKAVRTMNKHEGKTGPYFPLKRYGRYQMAAVNADTQEKYYLRSDSKSELEAERGRLEAQGVTVHSVSVVDKNSVRYSAQNANAVLEAALNNTKGDAKATKTARDAILKAFVSAAPEQSMQKHFMVRSGVSGASTNVNRNMASYNQAVNWSISSLKYSTDIQTALGSIRKAVKEGGGDQESRSLAANELSNRVNNPAKGSGKLMSGVAGYSFVNYLMSFSYSIVNSTQPITVTLPRMSEQYGAMDSMAALKRAYGVAFPGLKSALIGQWGGVKAFTAEGMNLDQGIQNVLESVTGDTKRMLEELRGRDMLGGGLTMDLTQSAKGHGASGKLAKGMDSFIEMGRTMPQMVEEMNRVVTALATYELEVSKGTSHELAVEMAERMIIKTHFDYTDLNKPPMFTKNDLMRAVTTYKMHPLGIYMNLAHYVAEPYNLAYRKLKGGEISQAEFDSALAKMKGLAMFMGTHSIFAGLAGGVILEPIGLALQAIASGMDDEDEMKVLFQNPDLLVRETMFALTGNEKASEALTYGLPRFAGMDMYSRIGIHRGFVQVEEGDSAVDTIINTVTASATGPIFSMKDQISNSANHFAAGDGFWNSASYVAPKAVRDVIRAFGLQADGMKDYRGNTIMGADEFDAGDAFIKGMGFGTSTEAEVYSNRSRDRSRKQNLEARATKIRRKYLDATGAERSRIIREDVREFNAGLTQEERKQKLNASKLLKATRSQKDRVRKTRQGVYSEKPTGMYPYSTLDR